MPRLALTHLTFIGGTVEPASVEFSPQVTVVRGPSDTGKSFIVNAVDFMFGANALKEIPERSGYSTALLGLQLPDGQSVTLTRAVNGGNVGLYLADVRRGPLGVPDETLAAKHNPKSEGNLSRYLLGHIGLDGKRVRKNARNETDSLSFRNLAHLCIVDETQMQAETAPALTGNYVSRTKEVSVLKLLLEDEDDSALVAVDSRQERNRLRGRTDRSGSSGGAGVPAVGGPGLPEQTAGDDDGVGQGDEGVDDAVVSFGADGELLESSVVPGVRALDDPAGSGLQGEPLDADHAVAAEFVEQVTGLGAVIPGIQVHRDPLGKSYPEPLVEAGEFGQGWAQQRGVVPVRRCDHAPQGDAGAVDEQGSFRAELASVHGRFARDVTAAGGLDDAPVDDHIRQVQPHDLVVGVQAELLELLEDPGVDPLITSGADRGRRAGRVRDPRVARPQDQHLDQLVEHDPVGDPWTVTPQRVRVHMVRDQRGELVPQRFDQRGWQSRHGRLPGAIGFDTSSPTRVRACTPSATRTPAVTSAPIRATSKRGEDRGDRPSPR